MEFKAWLFGCTTKPESILAALKQQPHVSGGFVSTGTKASVTKKGHATNKCGIRILCVSSEWKVLDELHSKETNARNRASFRSVLGLEFSTGSWKLNYCFKPLRTPLVQKARKSLNSSSEAFIGQFGILPEDEVAQHLAAIQAAKDSERSEATMAQNSANVARNLVSRAKADKAEERLELTFEQEKRLLVAFEGTREHVRRSAQLSLEIMENQKKAYEASQAATVRPGRKFTFVQKPTPGDKWEKFKKSVEVIERAKNAAFNGKRMRSSAPVSDSAADDQCFEVEN